MGSVLSRHQHGLEHRMRDVIDQYLGDLDAALGGSGRRRRRIESEVRDHLVCAVEAAMGAGEPRTVAVDHALAAFGTVDQVATAFTRNAARAGVQLTSQLTLAASVVYALAFAFSTQLPTALPGQLFSSALAQAAGWFAVQLVLVCAVVGCVQAWVTRGDQGRAAARLALQARFASVALLASSLSVGLALAGGAGRSSVLLALAVLALAAAAGVSLGSARRQLSALVRLRPEENQNVSAYDDLAAVLRLVTHRITESPLLGTGTRWLSLEAPALRRARAALSPHTRPWRFCAAVAFAAGSGVAIEHLIAEGTANVLTLAAVSAILTGIEAAAVALCFALLGGRLGLRPRPRSLA
jgi:hypothetical protein